MSKIVLTGGPKDGVAVEVDAGQVEVMEGGCVYRHCGKTGCYIYWGGEATEPEPTPEPPPLFDEGKPDDDDDGED